MKRLNQLLSTLVLGGIHIYQKIISPITPSACRFTPTCSHYAKTAIQRFGFWKGGGLALRRISRCHPLGGSGYDPVPEK